MSTAHAGDAPGHDDRATGHHATDDHGADHGHDDHGHGAGSLGPIDVAAWGAGALGVVLGLVVAFCFVVATALMSASPA